MREFDLRAIKLCRVYFSSIFKKSQVDELQKIVSERTGEKAQTIPTIRARIAYINGDRLILKARKVKQEQGRIGARIRRNLPTEFGRQRNRPSPEVGGIIRQNSDVPEVSVEEGMSKDLGVAVGDSVTFDISGRKITARVANIRDIDLRNTRTAFVFVFAPGNFGRSSADLRRHRN